MNPLKVRVCFTVELKDPQQWTDAFGVAGTAEIRADVRNYIVGQAVSGGCFAGEVDAEIIAEK